MREFRFLEPASIEEASRLLAQHQRGRARLCRRHGADPGAAPASAVTHPRSVAGEARCLARHHRRCEKRPAHRCAHRHAERWRGGNGRAPLPDAGCDGRAPRQPTGAQPGHAGRQPLLCRPATDPPTCLLALDAQIEIASTRGTRRLTPSAIFRRLLHHRSNPARSSWRCTCNPAAGFARPDTASCAPPPSIGRW